MGRKKRGGGTGLAAEKNIKTRTEQVQRIECNNFFVKPLQWDIGGAEKDSV